MKIRLFATGIAALVGLALVAVPAERADSASRKRGGTVTGIVDGDTIWVDVDADGRGSIEIRVSGLNTHEWFACMGPEATARFKDFIDVGSRVKLKGDLNGPLDQHGRVHLRVFKGKTELARKLLKEGLAIPMPEAPLSAKVNRIYRQKARIAQEAGIGIWDDEICGTGPQQNADISIRAMWEADGLDETNLGGEWVEVRNDGSGGLNISGWEMRDATRKQYFFPSNTILDPGESVRVTGGPGGAFHWGNTDEPLFSRFGDGVYLFDRDGDIRAYFEFPCLFECGDPLIGKAEVFVNFDAKGKDTDNVNGEWVDIANTSDGPINLHDYLLYSDGAVYHFDVESVVLPGEYMRVRVGHGTDGPLVRYWGKDKPIFNNKGDYLELWGFDGRVIDRFEWPCSPCGPVPDVVITFINPKSIDDTTFPNGEFIDVENRSGAAVAMKGWTLKSSKVVYKFPGSFVLGDGESVRVFVGEGSDSGDSVFWGRSSGILKNDSGFVTLRTAYLDGVDCWGWGGAVCEPAPSPRPIKITVDYTGSNPNDESVSLKNQGSSTIDLDGYKLVHRGRVYEFSGFRLRAGDTVTVFGGVGSDSGNSLYWGQSATFILSSGEVILYEAVEGAVAASASW